MISEKRVDDPYEIISQCPLENDLSGIIKQVKYLKNTLSRNKKISNLDDKYIDILNKFIQSRESIIKIYKELNIERIDKDEEVYRQLFIRNKDADSLNHISNICFTHDIEGIKDQIIFLEYCKSEFDKNVSAIHDTYDISNIDINILIIELRFRKDCLKFMETKNIQNINLYLYMVDLSAYELLDIQDIIRQHAKKYFKKHIEEKIMYYQLWYEYLHLAKEMSIADEILNSIKLVKKLHPSKENWIKTKIELAQLARGYAEKSGHTYEWGYQWAENKYTVNGKHIKAIDLRRAYHQSLIHSKNKSNR